MKIVIAYDGSNDAKEGLKIAQRFAKENQVEITLLYVARKTEDMSKEDEEKAIKKGEEILKRAKSAIEEGISVKEVVVSDYSIAEAILKFVEKEEADLLIMGARGVRPDIIRYTLGSTAAKVANFAPCSIYIVKKKES
jgi:nucleotide-binding universal stress UspA family protein